MKKNEKGSTLLWTIIVIGVLAVTIAAALTITYSYYNRTIANNSKRQAYLTSKGVIQNLVNKINSNTQEYLNLFSGMKLGDKKDIRITLPTNAGLGEVTGASIEMKSEKIDNTDYPILTLSVQSEYNGQSSLVKADMQEGRIDGINTWQLLKYYEDDYEIKESINIKNAKQLLKEVNEITSQSNIDTYLKNKDPEGYANYAKYYGPMYKNNDIIRAYLFLRNDLSGKWETTFDFSVVEDQTLADNLKKMSELPANKGDPYSIQPFYCNEKKTDLKNQKNVFIYASYNGDTLIKKSDGSGGYILETNWNDVHLIFDHDTGHWYYIDKVQPYYINKSYKSNTTTPDTNNTTLGATMFNGTDSMESKEIWERFRYYYIDQKEKPEGLIPAIRID